MSNSTGRQLWLHQEKQAKRAGVGLGGGGNGRHLSHYLTYIYQTGQNLSNLLSEAEIKILEFLFQKGGLT